MDILRVLIIIGVLLGLGAGVFENGADCDSEIIRKINRRAAQFQNLVSVGKLNFHFSVGKCPSLNYY